MIYLDNAATTFPKPEEVYKSIDDCMRNYGANPGRSGHKLALKAGRGIYETRELICKLFNIENPMRVTFTQNATDALNLGIKGILKQGDHVITTSMEHNSVIRPIISLEEKGVTNTIVQCDLNGNLDINKLDEAIKENTKLIVVSHSSNVTGNIVDIKTIGDLCKKKNITFLVDAAQTAGVIDINVGEENIDLLAFPGHKGLLGPQGTGGLYIREGIDIMHMKEGGTGSKSELLTQPIIVPDRYESGTPNTPGIIGLGAGVKDVLENIEKIREHEQHMTDYMLKRLEEIEKITVYGNSRDVKRSAVISINIEDIDSSEVSYILDEVYDIAVRSGLHCAPLAHKTIGTIRQGTVRFSFGPFTTKKDIDNAIVALKEICKELN